LYPGAVGGGSYDALSGPDRGATPTDALLVLVLVHGGDDDDMARNSGNTTFNCPPYPTLILSSLALLGSITWTYASASGTVRAPVCPAWAACRTVSVHALPLTSDERDVPVRSNNDRSVRQVHVLPGPRACLRTDDIAAYACVYTCATQSPDSPEFIVE
jgi:hypothetical protein